MTCTLRQFWARLDGPVHPDDRPVFAAGQGRFGFNLDFPPPAFIGDVDNASVVILMANGGYAATRTPYEFQDQNDHDEYIDWLAGRRNIAPAKLSSYYTLNSYYPFIESGKAVLVNAVAYRSPSISREPKNQTFGKSLPSYRAHRAWLKDELLPQVRRGQRLVIAHRYSLWELKSSAALGPNFIFSRNPVSEFLARDLLEKISTWRPEAGLHEQ